MGLLERIIFFSIGVGIGFILGYVVARLRSIEAEVDAVKREVHEVDEFVKHQKDEKGRLNLSRPTFQQVLLLIVVVMTVFAAFSAANTNGDLRQTVKCLTKYNMRQTETLTAQDNANKAVTQSEIHLWRTYDRLYETATKDPKQIPAVQEQLRAIIQDHREKLETVQESREQYAYQDPDILKTCKEQR